MVKSKKNKSGSNSNNVSKKGDNTKKGKSETTKKEEVKVEPVLAVGTVDDTKEEPSWDLLNDEEIDRRCSRPAKIVKEENVPTSSRSNAKVVTEAKPSRVTKPNYPIFDTNKKQPEDEFRNFEKLLDGKGNPPPNIEYTKVVEIEQDLFTMSREHSLAHCVAEDLNMGSGIAVQFSNQFKRHGELADQRQKQGGLAVLDYPNRFIYYLVTKRNSSGKPTYSTLWNSLTKMQKHVEKNSVKQMAMPRIGCGLDRLDWNTVKFMIQHIFKDTDVQITVCNFQQNYGKTKQKIQQKSDLPKNTKKKGKRK